MADHYFDDTDPSHEEYNPQNDINYLREKIKYLEKKTHKERKPCEHPGCLHHVSHHCEGCGCIAGRTKQLAIYHRKAYEANTDPQRRCYNGCHFSSELRWTDWKLFEYVTEENKERRMQFWQGLNAYAVSQRGEFAKAEYEIREVEDGKDTD